VKSLSVAVLLDEKVPAASQTAIQETVKTVIAAYPAPNGASWPVTVQAAPFDTSSEAAERKFAERAAASEQMSRILAYAVPLGLMLLMLAILARGLKRPLSREALALGSGGRPMLAGAGGGGLDISIGDALPTPGTSVGQALEVVPRAVYNPLDPDAKAFEVIEEAFDANLESILHLSKTKPDIVASMLRSWLSDEKR
jgi:flagellar M-ring protein FliF